MNPADLSSTTTLLVPRNVLRQTQAFMRRQGKEIKESIVLWAGRPEDTRRFRVNRAVFPEQNGTIVTVNVSEEEIQRVDDEARARAEVIGAQLHTHPTDAFHSDTDDATPIIHKVGAYSIVIPHFARESIERLPGAAAVRLEPRGWSEPLTRDELDALIEVI